MSARRRPQRLLNLAGSGGSDTLPVFDTTTEAVQSRPQDDQPPAPSRPALRPAPAPTDLSSPDASPVLRPRPGRQVRVSDRACGPLMHRVRRCLLDRRARTGRAVSLNELLGALTPSVTDEHAMRELVQAWRARRAAIDDGTHADEPINARLDADEVTRLASIIEDARVSGMRVTRKEIYEALLDQATIDQAALDEALDQPAGVT